MVISKKKFTYRFPQVSTFQYLMHVDYVGPNMVLNMLPDMV